jgi:hypothetical protein
MFRSVILFRIIKPRLLLIVLISISFIIGLGGTLYGETNFLIEAYAEEGEKVKKRIDALGTEGFIPVGIEIESDSGLMVFYVQDPSFRFENWLLFNHELNEDFEAEVTGLLKEGWVPMDIAKTEKGITMLYVKGGTVEDITVDGWRIAKSEMNTDTLQNVLSDFREKGFTPWGLSLDGKDVWYLFIDDNTAQNKQFFVEGYKLDSDYVKKSITDDINNGWMPWGMMMENLSTFILYTKSNT